MKILYHHRTRAEDAQGIHIQEIVNAFRKLGHQVEVVGIIAPEENAKQQDNSLLISSFAARVPQWLYELFEILYNFYGFYLLQKKVRVFHPDCIYERYALYNFSGILASKLYKIPLLLEVNSPLSYEKSKYSKLFLAGVARRLERWICSRAYKTIVVSTPMKNILKDIGVPDDKMVVISNGINPDYFNPEIDGSLVRKKFGLEDKIVLGFVGWFRKWHGLEELLRSYVNYKMAKKNIHILLVGDGPAYNDLVDFAKANNILDTGVTFTGPISRNEIPKYISAFDLTLQPDVTDYASPIKMFEYMGMGKGVIAPNKENIREIVKEGYEALFQPGNFNDMAKVILKYSRSKEKVINLGKQAIKIMMEHKYYWLENAKKSIALLPDINFGEDKSI